MSWFKSNKVEARIANILKGTSDPSSLVGDNGQLYLKYGSYEKHYFMDNKIVVVENKNDTTDLKLYIVGLTKDSSGIAITDPDLLTYLSDITSGYLKGCCTYDTADSTTQTGLLAIGDWESGMALQTYIPGWTQYKAGTFYGVIDLTQSPVPAQGFPTYQENPFVDPDTIVDGGVLNSFAKVNNQWQNLINTNIDDINSTTDVNKYYLGQLIERVVDSSLKITDSGHDEGFYPYYAFNGISPSDLRNPSNCWSATQDDANAWIQYDFDRLYWFNKIAIKCFSNYSDAWVGNIKVLGSQDGVTWENALIGATSYEITAPLQDFATVEIPLNDTKEYQHIRIQADDNAFTVYYAPSCFFDEIYVYGGIAVISSVNFKQGTFVSASSQFGIVDVVCGFKPDLVMVKLPFTGGDTVSYWEKGLSYAQNTAIWCLKPVEDVAYDVALGRENGETGIQAINDNGFSFMSNGWNTLGITCEYIAVQYEVEPIPVIENYTTNYFPVLLDSDYYTVFSKVANDEIYCGNRGGTRASDDPVLYFCCCTNGYWGYGLIGLTSASVQITATTGYGSAEYYTQTTTNGNTVYLARLGAMIGGLADLDFRHNYFRIAIGGSQYIEQDSSTNLFDQAFVDAAYEALTALSQ